MRKEIKLRFGKKDDVLKLWWNEVSASGNNISQTIKYAIDIYRFSGEYPNIATIKEEHIEDDILRKFSLQDDSDTYKWLLARQDKGEKISSAVKRILRNSINQGQDTSLVELDTLIWLSEQAESNYKTYIKANIEKPIPQYVAPPQEDKPSDSTEIKSPKEDSDLDNHNQFPLNGEEDDEPDLFEMLGANQLIL